jgi:hypothetical protein
MEKSRKIREKLEKYGKIINKIIQQCILVTISNSRLAYPNKGI